jgi:hypothetical protein
MLSYQVDLDDAAFDGPPAPAAVFVALPSVLVDRAAENTLPRIDIDAVPPCVSEPVDLAADE